MCGWHNNCNEQNTCQVILEEYAAKWLSGFSQNSTKFWLYILSGLTIFLISPVLCFRFIIQKLRTDN
jgi:hypothetical protein